MRIALLVVWMCSLAHAEPTFAVDLRGKDALADKMTIALEQTLREVGSARRAEYRAKGTRKDRVAASTDECPDALTAKCAMAIGTRLGVDYMFVGWVETRGKKLVLTLDVWSIASGKRVRSLRDVTAATTDAKKWGKLVYSRIVDTATGALVITCNAQRATVLVDGQVATELYQGRGTVSGLARGTHAIEIRAGGYKTYVDDVTVDGDTPLNVLLDRPVR